MKQPTLIYADFMKVDYENRLQLVSFGTFRDLRENDLTLEEGMKLVFYNDDEDDEGNQDNLVVEGTVKFDKENNRYAAKIVWENIKNISQLTLQEKKRLGFL